MKFSPYLWSSDHGKVISLYKAPWCGVYCIEVLFYVFSLIKRISIFLIAILENKNCNKKRRYHMYKQHAIALCLYQSGEINKYKIERIVKMQFATTKTKTDKEMVIEWVNNSDQFSETQKAFFRRIAYLTNNSENTCTAGNSYFEANFGRCARTIQRWLKAFIDCKCLVVRLVYDGKRVVKRLISISAEVLKCAAKIASNKLTLKDFKVICKRIKNDITHFHSKSAKDMFLSDNVAFCQMNVAYNNYNNILDTKEKKDLLYKYNKSKKEKVSRNSRPQNYGEVLKFWVDKNLEGTARAFWKYNTKRAWSNIHNWKRAAIGWAKKAKDNLAAFKANKTKHTEPYSSDYESMLPDLSYNSWDIL